MAHQEKDSRGTETIYKDDGRKFLFKIFCGFFRLNNPVFLGQFNASSDEELQCLS